MKRLLIMCALLAGCATNRPRTVVDPGSVNKPDWVSSPKVSWAEGDQVLFRNQYTIRGDERLNGCFQLVRLDAKESLLREIAEDLRGQIDSAQEGLSESAELALTQVRSSEFSGKVVGMKITEQYSERYTTNGVERIDCFVLASIKKTDYDSVKRQVLYKVAEADPDVKKAIKARAIKFFSDEKDKKSDLGQSSAPASAKSASPSVTETAQHKSTTSEGEEQ